MSRVLIIGSQHGNEKLGDQLMSYIRDRYPQLLTCTQFIIGNPKAHQLNKRFTETDMNRSYKLPAYSYEERRAQFLLEHIAQKKFDLVLDLHTTSCNQAPSLIVASINKANQKFLAACPFEHILVMQLAVVSTSLIGNVPCAVSIEVSRSAVTEALLLQCSESIANYLMDLSLYRRKKVYFVDGLIDKKQPTTNEFKNLLQTRHGFYPVLMGEASYLRYTPYVGFKASRMKEIKL